MKNLLSKLAKLNEVAPVTTKVFDLSNPDDVKEALQKVNSLKEDFNAIKESEKELERDSFFWPFRSIFGSIIDSDFIKDTLNEIEDELNERLENFENSNAGKMVEPAKEVEEPKKEYVKPECCCQTCTSEVEDDDTCCCCDRPSDDVTRKEYKEMKALVNEYFDEYIRPYTKLSEQVQEEIKDSLVEFGCWLEYK